MQERKEGSRERKKRRIGVALSCRVCGARNYKTTRPSGESTPGLVLKKFCKNCNCHTEHQESR